MAAVAQSEDADAAQLTRERNARRRAAAEQAPREEADAVLLGQLLAERDTLRATVAAQASRAVAPVAAVTRAVTQRLPATITSHSHVKQGLRAWAEWWIDLGFSCCACSLQLAQLIALVLLVVFLWHAAGFAMSAAGALRRHVLGF
jgi:hypothetical protein